MNPNPIGQLSDTRSLILKAYAAMKEEAWDAAKELADASLRACKLTGDYLGEINARHLQARIDHETGQLETAAKQYEQVHQLSEAIDYKDGIARVKHEMGRIYSRRGEFLKAEEGFRYALHFYTARRELNNIQAAINCLAQLGRDALSVPDHFLPKLISEEIPFGPPEEYLDIHATSIVAEFNEYYRRRLLQKGLAAFGSRPEIFRYALDRALRAARFVQDEFIETTARIFLSQPEPALQAPSAHYPTIRTNRPSGRFATPDAAAPSLDELFESLAVDDRPGAFAYRGQTREYPGPLLPSAFRGIIEPTDEPLDQNSPLLQYSVRSCGNSFYGDYNYKFGARLGRLFEDIPADAADNVRGVYDEALRSQSVVLDQRTALSDGRVLPWNEALASKLSSTERDIYEQYRQRWRPFVDSYHRRCIRQSFLRPFGYFLGTTLAQQYGLSSEGLDVTKSLEVAAFFAAFESSSDFVSTPKAGTGVIYRFPYTAPDIRYHRINDYDYYSLPSIIDTEDVLYRFERRGLAIGDVLKCFEAYFGAVFLDGLQNTDLFFLPEGALANSRVTRQKALIILPDELRRDLPSGTAFRFVEDLAKRDGVEQYYFHHTGRSPESVKLQRQDLWPRDDPFVQIIVAILTAVYPLSAFLPDIMPQRLDLIDAGYDHADFLQLCEKFAISHHMVLYDHDAMMATRSGTLIL